MSRKREPAVLKAAKILLRGTGRGDTTGSKAVQKGIQKGCAEFAALQKVSELAETVVCLQRHNGQGEISL